MHRLDEQSYVGMRELFKYGKISWHEGDGLADDDVSPTGVVRTRRLPIGAEKPAGTFASLCPVMVIKIARVNKVQRHCDDLTTSVGFLALHKSWE